MVKFFFLDRNFKGPSEQPFKRLLNVRPWRPSKGVCMFFFLFFFTLEITILWRNNEVKTNSHSSGILYHSSSPQQGIYRAERDKKVRGVGHATLAYPLYLFVHYLEICFQILNIDMPKLKGKVTQSKRAWALGRERRENIAAEHENEDAGLALEQVIPNKFLLGGYQVPPDY